MGDGDRGEFCGRDGPCQPGLEGRGETLLKNYSKGMQQRLGIAQAIIADPDGHNLGVAAGQEVGDLVARAALDDA